MRSTAVAALGVLAACGAAQGKANAAAGSNCDYVSDKVYYLDVDKITASHVYLGKAPLPKNAQGAFWLVDDGGDALVAFGTSPDGDDSGECSNGKLVQEADSSRYCTTVSTVRPGGWTFQAFGTPSPGVSGGEFPTAADRFYRMCGTKWQFCFDSNVTTAQLEAIPLITRGPPCINVFALTSTVGEYKGTKYGGEYWRITTKALGIPLPSFVPGNFDMIQVMDGEGNKVQPAWDMFAKANKQIVIYDDANGTEPGEAELIV